MQYRLYRASVENFLTGRPRMTQKLVVEDSVLFEDNYAECRVMLVAYSNEERSTAEYRVTYRDDTTQLLHFSFQNSELFNAAATGVNELTMLLYRGFLNGEQPA